MKLASRNWKVFVFMQAERATSGCNLGCRALWHRLRMKHRLSVSRYDMSSEGGNK